MLGRVIGAVLLAFVGAGFGLIGTFAHQATIELAGVAVPWALFVAMAGVTALLLGIRLLTDDRLLVITTAFGLVGTVFVLSLPSDGGSVLIPDGIAGVTWSIGPTLVAVLVAGWPRIPARRDASDRLGGPDPARVSHRDA